MARCYWRLAGNSDEVIADLPLLTPRLERESAINAKGFRNERWARAGWAGQFLADVEPVLVPTLKPGDVAIMNNLGSHKGRAVRTALRKARAHLLFLPPYSPHLNPIEQAFAKLKSQTSKADERSIETVWRRIGALLDMFSAQKCANYIRHAGYAST
jgi:transposase